MNCEESKNLIVEMNEADEVSSNAELSAHLAACSTCRQFLKYELKMRDGFEEIASEPLPAEVARKILAVPRIVSNETSAASPEWVKRLSAFISSMTFKIALASGITGFAAAIIFLRGFTPGFDRHSHPAAEDLKQVKRLERPLFNRDSSFPQPASTTTVAAAGAAVTINPELKKKLETRSRLTDDLLALKAEEGIAVTAERKAAVSEHIPGAVSFSLDENADASGRFAMAPAAPAAETGELVFDEAEQVSAESDDKAQDAMVMASAPKLKEVLRSLPTSAKSSGVTKSDMADSFAASETEVRSDPRAAAILKFLESNGLVSEEGFIDLDDLFIKGYIDNSQRREWRAPDGNDWYLTRTGNRPAIILRRKP
jgi:hypothetical protein